MALNAATTLPTTKHTVQDPQSLNRKKVKQVDLFWEGIPPKSTFQQRDKNFHPTACARLAMAQWQAILEQTIPDEPLQGPLEFRMILTWPHTAESKREADRTGRSAVRKTTRPDGSNILKGVEDIMTRLGYWNDDAQLCIEHVERWYGIVPGVVIIAKELE